MGVGTLNPTDYGRLCADLIPKIIESDDLMQQRGLTLADLLPIFGKPQRCL